MPTTWQILEAIACICVFVSLWMGRNAIWGGLTLGIIIAVIVVLIKGWNENVFSRILTVCVLIGAFFEIISRFASQKRPLK